MTLEENNAIEWKHDPGCKVQAPLTFGEGYVFSHRRESGEWVFCGTYRSKSEYEPLGWFRSIGAAKTAAERHKTGKRCSCGIWERFHNPSCPLVEAAP